MNINNNIRSSYLKDNNIKNNNLKNNKQQKQDKSIRDNTKHIDNINNQEDGYILDLSYDFSGNNSSDNNSSDNNSSDNNSSNNSSDNNSSDNNSSNNSSDNNSSDNYSIEALKSQAQSFMLDRENAKVSAKNQKESFDVINQCVEIANKIMNGDKVPIKDEQFLLKNDPAMYSRAVTFMKQNDDPKEHQEISEEPRLEEYLSLEDIDTSSVNVNLGSGSSSSGVVSSNSSSISISV